MKLKVVLDSGHGGSDSGAIGPTGLRECDVALAISLELEKLIQAAGHECLLTRVRDTDVSHPGAPGEVELGARCEVANEWGADLFISIHCDAFTNPAAQGTTTYYMRGSEQGRQFAEVVHGHLVNAIQRQDRGVREAGFYVLKHTNMPAILVEVAFISNPTEEKLLNSPNFRYNIARSLLDGILDYTKVNIPTHTEKPVTDNPTQSKEDWQDAGIYRKE
jgi:N-acetylmuramoyl-L-alanine amidase